MALANLASAFMAGIVAGLLFGVSARIAMRSLALGMNAPLRLSVSGSLTVILIFSCLGMALALPYPALFRTEKRGHPLAYAFVLILSTLQPFIRAAAQDLVASPWELRVIIGSTLVTFLLWFPYAIVLEAVFSRVALWLRASTSAEPITAP